MRRLLVMLMLWPIEINCARNEFDMGIARAAPSWNPEVQERTTRAVKSDVVRLSPPTTPTTPPLPPIDPDEQFLGGGNLILGKTDPVNLLTTTLRPITFLNNPPDINDIESVDKNDEDYKIPSVFLVITDEPLITNPTPTAPRLLPPPIRQFTPSSPSRPQARPPEPSVHVVRPIITRIKPYGSLNDRREPAPHVFIPKPTFTPRSLNLQEIHNLEDTTTLAPPVVTTIATTTTTESIRKKMSGQFPPRQPKSIPPQSLPQEFRPIPPEALFFHGGHFYSRIPQRTIRYVSVPYRIPVFRPPPLYNSVYQYYEPAPVNYRPRGQSRPRRRYRTAARNIPHNHIRKAYRNSRSLHRGAVK